jgi:hypothetical protein
MMRISRIFVSRDPIAIATVENAITAAEALLTRGGHIVTNPPRPGARLRILDDPEEFQRVFGWMRPAEFAKTAEGKAALKATQERRKAAKKGSQPFVAKVRNDYA